MGLAEHLGGLDDRDALLEALFEHSPTALQIFDANGHPVIHNHALAAMMGRPPPPEYCVLRDEILARQGALPLIRRAFDGEVVVIPPAWHDPRHVEHVDGTGTSRAGVHVTLVPLRDRAGGVQHVLVFGKDATSELELRAREERQRQAFAAARIVAIDASLVTRELHQTDDVADVLGLAPGAALATLDDLIALVHPEDRETFHAAVADGATRELRIVRPRDGAVTWLEQRTRVERDDVSGHPWLHGILIDITERVALRRAQRLESIGRLAGGLAHDFNNMLTVILCQAGVLARDPQARGAVDAITEAGTQAAALTRQLLAFSSPHASAPRALDVADTVRQAGRMLDHVLDDDIELVIRGDAASVRVDPGQLAQVVMNLVLNARDAMPAGGTVTITTARAGGEVRLSVADTGAGMDEATQRRIFEPFFTTKPHGQGTGLGLASVLAIVQRAGGRIEVHSAPGAGSTFDVFLPAVDAPVEPVAVADAAALRGHETVLVVDDQAPVRSAVRDALEAYGYRVLVATNAGDALLVCEGEPGAIDLLLTDVVMPHVGGPALARRLAPLRPQMRVLLMTGHDAREPSAPDAYASIAKPLAPEALARRVRDVLDA